MTVDMSGEKEACLPQSSGAAMCIAFESTIDERVKAHMRLYELTGMLRRQKWLPLVLAPLGALACYSLLPGSPGGRLFFAAFFAAVFTAFHLAFYKSQLRRQMRKLLVRQISTADPVPSEYELTDKGITFRQRGMEVTFAWSVVREIRDAGDAIEFIVDPAGISRVPVRIFRDAAQRQAWLEFAGSRVPDRAARGLSDHGPSTTGPGSPGA